MAGRHDAQAWQRLAPTGSPSRLGARRRRSARGAGHRSERGAALVEAVLVLPLLLLIVFGVVEFGITFNNYISLRDGIRQAARQGVVGNLTGQSTSCGLVGADEASTTVKQVMCLTKAQTGLDQDQIRIKVMSASSTFSGAGTFAKNDALVICAQVPVTAVTGFLSSALTGKTLRSKLAMRIEKGDLGADGEVLTAGEEDPPTGRDWTWCSYDAASE